MGVVTLAALAALLVLGAAPAQAQNGVGSASARGTDSNGEWFNSGPVTVQYSARTNCDATQSTGPFYVRWTVGATTFTFKQTGAADTSRCFSVGGVNGNEGGFATGMLLNDGSPADVSWLFRDNFFGPGADDVIITVITSSGIADSGILTVLGGEPEPLFGSPGGVWVRGTLPWPAL